jgi:Alginate lyase
MRRPSVVVLLAVVTCAITAWTGASVLAQPHEHHQGSAARSAPEGPLRYLTRGGYLPGSATRAASGAAGVAGITRPSQVLDLRNWYLTLPTGHSGAPDTVRQPALAGYSSPFFQLDQGRDGVVFTSNAGGVTTANSTYPRSELREMDGDKLASWSDTSGTHTLEVRQAVAELPKVKPELVTAQIHDTESDVIEIRLEGNRLVGRYADGKKEFVVDPDYVLGTPYDLRMVAAGGRIDVWYNGGHVGGVAQSGSGWYFKTGSYLQSNTERGDAANAVGKVVLYAATVTHSA